jgi:hypothetical protein
MWRKLCQVPDNHRASSRISLKGVSYTLFVDFSEALWHPKLYSCDSEAGACRIPQVASSTRYIATGSELGSLVLGGVHWTSKVSVLSFWSIFGEG